MEIKRRDVVPVAAMAWRLTKVEPNSLVMPHRCWLRTWGWQNGQGFYLNDHNCNYCYQTYLCSTNQMAAAPTTSPTKVPTVKPTATPDYELVGVTGSVIVSGLSTTRADADGECYAGNLRSLSDFAPKDWYEATTMCAAEGKVLCGVEQPCKNKGCSYNNHYQWTGEECRAGDAGLPAECASA